VRETEPLSLYLHIPFCRHRCSYCDFNTYTTVNDLQAPYVAALAAEIRQVAGEARRPVDTVFFGGGTPSLLMPEEVATLLTAVRTAFILSPTAEITMEANPDTVDTSYLSVVRAAGVNRLSFGVQSAVPGELALLDREHDFAGVETAVAAARAAGFTDINLDLIYGVPGQTLASWRQSVAAVLALQPTHLSLYCLTIEPGTPMQRWLLTGKIQPPDPDLAADQYDLACEKMKDAGFDHYEISNWAQPGRACRHNLTYWRNGEYLGLGAGAHGHAAGVRYQVVRQPRVYIRRMQNGAPGPYPLSAAAAERYSLTAAEQMSDTVMTQLRLLNEGLDLSAFAARFGRPFHDQYAAPLAQLTAWGLLQQRGDRLLLTEKGWFLSNQVFVQFV
jgi:oxygen-independent coproporphyrinogen-3 oxidase